MNTLKLSVTILFFLYFLIVFIVFQIDTIKMWWKKNWWVIHTILLMVVIVVIGIFAINALIGKPQLYLPLYDNMNLSIVGNISCDAGGMLLVGNEIRCEIYPRLSNMNGTVTFYLQNGTYVPQDFFYVIKFIAPPKLEVIFFSINGLDEANKYRLLSVRSNFKFLDEEEEQKREDKLISFLLALVGIVLFSVPSAMINLRDLYQRLNLATSA